MYDAIVIGARCAGSPTAMLLARRGHRVLVLDRAAFPSDTLSTHFIQLPGMARLKRWGLLETVMSTGCPPVTSGTLDIDGQRMEAEFENTAGIDALAAPRRTVLDKILVDAAVAAGAELREGVYIDSLIQEDGRVTGVRGHTADGEFSESARLVVGADGRNSVVAKEVGAEAETFVPALGCGYYAYYSGVECTQAELYLYEGCFAAAFPTNEGLTTVPLGLPPSKAKTIKQNREEQLLSAADELGTLGERLRAGRLEGKVVAMADVPNYLRTAQGPGWALVGDAAYNKDPTPADGITDAFRGADLLAEEAHRWLGGEIPESEGLARYQGRHHEAARPMLASTLTMSSFDKTPLERATGFLELTALHEQELGTILPDLETMETV
jgi:2-polyprenyl-6-methoxyphenol hydroxylase-like FAD-dependent oxidoreductase